LVITQYNEKKWIFLKRSLQEKVDPSCTRFLSEFDAALVEKCRGYVKQFYPDEAPVTPNEAPVTPGEAPLNPNEASVNPDEALSS